MRTSVLTGRAAGLLDAEVTFGCFKNRLEILIYQELTFVRSHLDHTDRLVGAIRRTGAAADAGGRIDHDFSAETGAVNRPSRASDHANRIHAVHAGVRNH